MRRRAVVAAAMAAVVLLTACHPDPTTGTPPARTAEVPPWRSTVQRVGPEPGRDVQLRSSWRPGCPVHYRNLRLVTLPFWGYDGRRHVGRLVVRLRAVEDVRFVFKKLYQTRFPIRRMQPIDVYGGDDDRSMAANNTSAFNCRRVAGTDTWSQHAYGTAVDINPQQNPSVDGSTADPPGGRPWTDRDHGGPGMAMPHAALTNGFGSRGWGWGGRWESSRDYMHFSENGR